VVGWPHTEWPGESDVVAIPRVQERPWQLLKSSNPHSPHPHRALLTDTSSQNIPHSLLLTDYPHSNKQCQYSCPVCSSYNNHPLAPLFNQQPDNNNNNNNNSSKPHLISGHCSWPKDQADEERSAIQFPSNTMRTGQDDP